MRNTHALVLVLGMILQQGSMFLLGLAVAHSLGPHPFGTFSLLRTLVLFAVTIAPLGLDLAVMKYSSGSMAREDFDPFFPALRLFAGANASVVVLAVIVVGWLLFRNDSGGVPWLPLLLAAFTLIPMGDTAIQSARGRAMGRAVLVSALADYLVSISRICGTAVVFFTGGGLTEFFSINFIALAVSSFALHLLVRSAPTSVALIAVGLRAAPRFISESVWMAASLAVHGLIRFSDLLVLGLWTDRAIVGSYAAISLVASFVQMYPAAIAVPVAPAVARLFKDGKTDAMVSQIRENMARSVLVGAYVFGGVAGFGPHLNLVFGNDFSFSWQVSFALALAWLASAVFASAGLAMSMTGAHRQEARILMGSLALLLLLLFSTVPKFGAVGAALSVLVCIALANMLRVYAVTRRFGRILPTGLIIMPVAAVISSSSISYFGSTFIQTEFSNLLYSCILYTVIYITICKNLKKYIQ